MLPLRIQTTMQITFSNRRKKVLKVGRTGNYGRLLSDRVTVVAFVHVVHIQLLHDVFMNKALHV